MIPIPAPMRVAEQPFAPFSSPDWLYELKFDGYRCIAGVDANSDVPLAQQMQARGTRVRLLTDAGDECTSWYPEIVRDLDLLPGGPHVIDGQACVLRADSTGDLHSLQHRVTRRMRIPGTLSATVCCFDLLVCNGKSTMHLPLMRRKELLSELLALIDDPKPALLFVQDLPADADVFGSMTLPKNQGGLAIEGVVAKRRDSTYRPGVRSDDWRKITRDGLNPSLV